MEKFIFPNQDYLQFSDCRLSQNDDYLSQDEIPGNSSAGIDDHCAIVFRSSISERSEFLRSRHPQGVV